MAIHDSILWDRVIKKRFPHEPLRMSSISFLLCLIPGCTSRATHSGERFMSDCLSLLSKLVLVLKEPEF